LEAKNRKCVSQVALRRVQLLKGGDLKGQGKRERKKMRLGVRKFMSNGWGKKTVSYRKRVVPEKKRCARSEKRVRKKKRTLGASAEV